MLCMVPIYHRAGSSLKYSQGIRISSQLYIILAWEGVMPLYCLYSLVK